MDLLPNVAELFGCDPHRLFATFVCSLFHGCCILNVFGFDSARHITLMYTTILCIQMYKGGYYKQAAGTVLATSPAFR